MTAEHLGEEPANQINVAVIGGGVAGLAAAWELSSTAAHGPQGRGGLRVQVFEASHQLGGKLRSEEFAGRLVDVGPDGFLARRPEAVQLCEEAGLQHDLMAVGATGASVWAKGRLNPLPDGLVLGVPTRIRPLARSRVLGVSGLLRVSMDRVFPRPDVRGPLGDRAIGPLVARKLGHRVVDLLVDPLVGGIHAGTTADMSAAAVFPMLLTAAQASGSFMRSMRKVAQQAIASSQDGNEVAEQEESNGQLGAGDDTSTIAGTQAVADSPTGKSQVDGSPSKGSAEWPAFWSLRHGMASLPARMAELLHNCGVRVQTNSPVRRLRKGRPGERSWVIETSAGSFEADGVVLAVPAPQAAQLLGPHQEEAPRLLRMVEHANVTVITLAFPREAISDSLYGTGLLVPRVARVPARHIDAEASPQAASSQAASSRWRRARREDRSFLVTAVTFLSAKWPHLSSPDDVLLRASVGRCGDERHSELNDDELLRRVLLELGILLGIETPPRQSMITRWPESLPQYRVHHPLRVSAIESGLRRLPAIALAGSTYQGVGIPSCISSGRMAARSVLEALRIEIAPVAFGPTSSKVR